MSNKQKAVPQIRFEGFTGAWEQRKLGEVTEFSKGSGYSKADLTSQGTPIILYGRLYTKYETEINDVDTFVHMRDNSVLSQGGEVIVPSSGETAEDISRASVVTKAGVILGGDLNIVKPNTTIHPPFLAVTISNGNQQKELSRRAQGKSVVHISNSDLMDVLLRLPCLEEQSSIGEFFRTFDTIITNQKRKLEGVKRLKKAYLQQMFPQVGETTPKMRFSGFTDPWISVSLGAISNIKTGASDVQDAVADGKYPFFVRSEKVERSNKYLFDGEAILVPGEGRLGDIYHYINGKFDYHQRVYKISDFSSDAHCLFVLYAMQKTFKQHAMTFTVRATVDSLRLPMLTDFNILLPIIEEQMKIGAFFVHIDTQITAQTQKLEQLSKLKAAYLQRMFI